MLAKPHVYTGYTLSNVALRKATVLLAEFAKVREQGSGNFWKLK